MKEGHTPIPRYRATTAPALFSQGFRPFFLLAGLWAPFALLLFLGALHGLFESPVGADPVSWHAHEMLFGYAAAVIAGFLLTAIPNWTGHLPLQGLPLVGLVALWVAGRIAMAGATLTGPWIAALIDVAFLGAMAIVAGREIVAGKNWRNLPIVAAVILLLLASALDHAGSLDLIDDAALGKRAGLAVVVALITLIGGRVVPSFTRNFLAKRRASWLPASFGSIDRISLAMTAIAIVYWAVTPDDLWTALAMAIAAFLSAVRLARWRGHATLGEPLVWSLHLGYVWIPIGFALMAASYWWPALPQSGAVHALTAGAIGTMTLAVMSRAVMGHTGRPLEAGPTLSAAYLLVSGGALLRIVASVWDDLGNVLLAAAALAWVAAFVVYLWVCGPMLVLKKPDRKSA